MKLQDLFEMNSIQYDGYRLDQEEDREEDNVKIFHTIYDPRGKMLGTLDHSPYEYLDEDDLAVYVEFFKKHGRFPSRTNIDSRGPIHNEELHNIIATTL